MIPFFNGSQTHGEGGQGDHAHTGELMSALPTPTEGVALKNPDGTYPNFTDIMVGYFTTMLKQEDGICYDIGGRLYGQGADGFKTGVPNGYPVETLLGPTLQFDMEGTHGIALTEEYQVLTWGGNGDGTIGNGTIGATEAGIGDYSVPQKLDLTAFERTEGKPIKVFAGPKHMGVLFESGRMAMWGRNAEAECGGGFASKDHLLKPRMATIAGVEDAALGGASTIVIKTDGSLWVVGRGVEGQFGKPLGKEIFSDRWTKIEIPGSFDKVAYAAYLWMAIRDDGTLFEGGECPKELIVPPREITEVKGIIDCSAGAYWTSAVRHVIDQNGDVFGKGGNPYYEIGDGTRARKTKFTPLHFKAKMVRTGERHTAFLV